MINEVALEAHSPLDFLIVLGPEYQRLEADYPSFLYFIQSGDHGPVKIGHAARPSVRAQELQIGCPVELTLRAVIACRGPGALEKRVHEGAKTYKVRGEWFDLSPLEAVEIALQIAAEANITVSPMNGAYERLAVRRTISVFG
jgi:hypothetical protein